MAAGGLTLLGEMVLVCWSLSFIDEDDAPADTMEPIPSCFSAPSAESEFLAFRRNFAGGRSRCVAAVIASGQTEPILLQLGIKSNTERFRNAIISVCVCNVSAGHPGPP